jgi:hypothetical protein
MKIFVTKINGSGSGPAVVLTGEGRASDYWMIHLIRYDWKIKLFCHFKKRIVIIIWWWLVQWSCIIHHDIAFGPMADIVLFT